MMPDNNEILPSESINERLSVSSELAASINGRTRELLDKLLPALSFMPYLRTQQPTLFSPYRYPGEDYAEWVKEFISRLYLPLTSIALFGHNSGFWLPPVPFTWFDPLLWRRFKRQGAAEEQYPAAIDDSIIDMSLPFTKENYASIFHNIQPPYISPHFPDLTRLINPVISNVGPVQRGRPARAIYRGLELAGKQSLFKPPAMPIESTSDPAYPWIEIDNRLIPQTAMPLNTGMHQFTRRTMLPLNTSKHQFKQQTIVPLNTGPYLLPVIHDDIVSSESPSHLHQVEALYPSLPAASPLSTLDTVSTRRGRREPALRRIEPALLPGNVVMTRDSTAPPLFAAFSSTDQESDSRPSEPFVLASETTSQGKAATDPITSVSRPLPVNDAPTGESEPVSTPVPRKSTSRPEEQTVHPAGIVFDEFQMVSARLSLSDNLGSRRTPTLHSLIRHTPFGLAEQAGAEDITSLVDTVRPGNGYGGVTSHNMSSGIELALAPVGRRRESTDATTSSTQAGEQSMAQTENEASSEIDTEALASEVYDILKRRLLIERERAQITI